MRAGLFPGIVASALILLTGVPPVSAQTNGNRVLWSGDVDGTVELEFRKKEVRVHVVSGKKTENVQSFFRKRLPEKSIRVQVLRQEGRGPVEVFQQPAKSNKFTTGVRISDEMNGRSHYRIVLTW
ncbi:MAG: hypothetical protein SFU56_17820 [Capsulimonadales bacterium]|nr:hypothetical protein [Capsulimonadales bacterium]